MKNRVKIVFDKASASYHCGDVITGRVKVQNGNDEVLELTWNGKQHVYWETHQPTSIDKSLRWDWLSDKGFLITDNISSAVTKKKLPGERPSETDTIIYFQTTQLLTDYQQLVILSPYH